MRSYPRTPRCVHAVPCAPDACMESAQSSQRSRWGSAGNSLQIVACRRSSASPSVMLSRIAPLAPAGQTVIRVRLSRNAISRAHPGRHASARGARTHAVH